MVIKHDMQVDNPPYRLSQLVLGQAHVKNEAIEERQMSASILAIGLFLLVSAPAQHQVRGLEDIQHLGEYETNPTSQVQM